MITYQSEVENFNFNQVFEKLISGKKQALNACYECCDRHANDGKIALYLHSKNGEKQQYTFEMLKEHSSKFANYLKSQGVGVGDRVSGLLPRNLELIITILAVWRLGAIYQPLFTAFGPKAIEHRVQTAQSKLVITDVSNREKLDDVQQCPKIVTVFSENILEKHQNDINFWTELNLQSDQIDMPLLDIDAPFLLMFTSGTTGLAKPLEVPLKALVAFGKYMQDAIGLTEDDVFWNIADPGWAYGLYYAITGPLLLGRTILLYDGGFSVESLCEIVNLYNVTNLAGAPTAYRMMIAADPEKMQSLKGKLKRVSSAGEPLNPEVIRWFEEFLSVPIYDHYGQTEVGMVVCNHHGLKHSIKAGSAGFAFPGYRVVVVDEAGNELPADTSGVLAIDLQQSPMMWFKGYKESQKSPFVGKYYLTGDTAEIHADGSMSFVGRNDDVITTSGYRIGPFDVESALLEHASVIEAAVIGVPDVERTEIIKAFVILSQQHKPSEELSEELSQFVKKRLSAHAYPRQIEFVSELPKTPSGKIQRFLLRNMEVEKQKKSA